MKGYIFDNRHIQKQVFNIEKNSCIVLANDLSIYLWKKYFDYNKLNHIESTINYITLNEYLNEFYMKFHNIIANPPFSKKVGPNHTEPIWDDIVKKSIELLEHRGTMTMIHPDTWRISTAFKEVKELILSKTLVSLDMYDEEQGRKIFDSGTPFDVYTLINEPNLDNKKTKIVGSDGIAIKRYLSSQDNYIPNGSFDAFDKLFAKNGEENVELISDSTYHTQRKHMNNKKDNDFIFPCVYTTTKDESINFWYSNVKSIHFGKPKVIWSNGMASSPIVDENGDYGITQFSFAIVDEPKNLEMIKKAMESEKFLQLMQHSQGKNQRYNKKVISFFKKDFWKEFIND